MAPVGLDRLEVWSIHCTAQIDVVAEVAGSDRLAPVGLKLLLVRSVNDAIAVDVGRQETKRNVSMRLSIAIDVLCVESHNLSTGHTCKLCRHAVTAEGNGSYRSRAADDSNLARCYRGIEGKDGVVSGSATTFYPGSTGQWHVHVEGSGGTMSQA